MMIVFSSIRWKFILYITLAIFLGQLATFLWTINNIKKDANISALENIKSDLALGEALIDCRFEGDWHIKDNLLYKGDNLIVHNSDIVEEIGQLTGNTCTIFQGDTRVATNIVRNNIKAIGTKVSEQVAQVVLIEGITYYGEAEVLGIKYQTIYKPLLDPNGDIIGMIYMGANKQLIDKMISNAFWNTVYTFSFSLIAMIIVIWLLTNSLTRPINKMVEAAKNLANGNLDKQISIRCSGEIGQLANSLESMRLHIKDNYNNLQRSYELLEESEHRFRNMVQNVQLVSVILDNQGNITFCNDYFIKLTGWQRDEIIGNNWIEMFIPHEKRQELMAQFKNIEKLDNQQKIREIVTRWGDRKIILCNNTLLRDSQGNVVGTAHIGEDVTERKIIEERMKYLATHDSLTNIPNRYHLEEILNKTVAQSSAKNTSALLFIDLDNFKLVNDSLGHEAGDSVLIAVVDILKGNIRKQDVLARLGGDEFAVLLRNTTPKEAQEIAETLRKSIDGNELCLAVYRQCFSLSISIGIVMIDGALDCQKLLSSADTALYGAKEKGRNRIVFMESIDNTSLELTKINKTISLIKHAIKEKRFVLHCQPVVCFKSNKIVHHEALIRLKDNEGKLIPPGLFIPIAERFGLMPQIDRWVVETALQYLVKHQDLKLFINLSGISMNDKELLIYIKDSISNSNIDPSRIGFEITETATVKDLVRAERWINSLKDIGCEFALDDFGIGFSSFSYLRILPVDYIKIDGSFINNLDKDPSNIALVQAISTVAKELNKKTIAEFVENEDVVKILIDIDVDCGQGYYLGKPSETPLKGRT